MCSSRLRAAIGWIAHALLKYVVGLFTLAAPNGAAHDELLRTGRGSGVCPMLLIGPSRFSLLRESFQSRAAYFWFDHSILLSI